MDWTRRFAVIQMGSNRGLAQDLHSCFVETHERQVRRKRLIAIHSSLRPEHFAIDRTYQPLTFCALQAASGSVIVGLRVRVSRAVHGPVSAEHI